MRLYDTATKDYLEFTPEKVVNIYTCGITPYDSAHLGHVFTFMTYDLLQRRLEEQDHEVRLVRNITDVDDPIFKKAKELDVPYTTLARDETQLFQGIMKQLNMRQPFAEPLASEYVSDMAEAVFKLLNNGHAYRLEDDVYFETERLGSFGSFSGYSEHLKLAFMHRRGGDPERVGKHNPLDFLLWRGISDMTDPAAWESPVGRGRPGWHIECSVMADKLLGVPFDLHGGGTDLIFPHHECEIAQSHGLGQSQLARHWVHVAQISYLAEKMSKSLGNLVFAKDLLADYEPAVIRMSLMYYHHRVGGEWQPEVLTRAQKLWDQLRALPSSISRADANLTLDRIRNALDDDLNTQEVMRVLRDCVRPPVAADGSGREILLQTFELLGLAVPSAQ